jgi:hypothetical protein
MRAVVFVLAFTMAVRSIESRAADPNQLPTYPQLGRYSNVFGVICGKNRVDTAPTEVPKIGCFAVKVGTSIMGEIEGRSIRVDIGIDGNESFFVDGKKLERVGSEVTNDPFVKNSSSGFAFCRKEEPSDCPTTINALERTPREFTIFSVAREFAPNSYVTTEENYEFEMSKRRNYSH